MATPLTGALRSTSASDDHRLAEKEGTVLFSGLPGGGCFRPATFRVLVIVTLVTIAVAGSFSWFLVYASRIAHG